VTSLQDVSRLARLPLAGITRAYPHKLDHVVTGDGEVTDPRAGLDITHSELSVIILSPAPERSVTSDRARMIGTERHGLPRAPGDGARNQRILQMAESELSDLVAAPAGQPRRIDPACMLVRGRDERTRRESNRRCRGRPRDRIANSELTKWIVVNKLV
jgi:hypothetical protein